MKKILLTALSLFILIFGTNCFAAPMGYSGTYAGGYGGSYGTYGGYNYRGGYGGGYRNPQYSHTQRGQYRYRPVTPITPALTKNNTVPPRTISCLGTTSSYVNIGQNVMPCESAAATRIRVSGDSKHSGTRKISSSNHNTNGTRTSSIRRNGMPKIHYVHQKMPKLSKNSKKNAG